MDVTICVATFGDVKWLKLAQSRAIPSAGAQADEIVTVHGDSLHDARNRALAMVHTEFVIFLDADDELEPGYLDAMAAGSADIRAPRTRYVTDSPRRHPVLQAPCFPRVVGHQHDCTADCLPEGNWVVIGAAARTELVRKVGGFRDFAWCEDWDLWLRCRAAAASFEAIDAAVYRAYVRPDSRNRGLARRGRQAAHRAIYDANFPVAA